MQIRTLGKDLKVSAVGMGCMGLTHAYGRPLEKYEAIKVIRAAFDMGYTFFDTAECYGPFTNEEAVGEALAPVRGSVKIATKFGVTLEEGSLGPHPDSRPEVIKKSVEGSLKRLKTDQIDLYYQHRIDPDIPPEEVAECMAEMTKEGKITHWGISETDEEYLRRAHAVCPVTAIQNRYSMMYRDYERLFPVLEELGVGFVAFSPLANGLLTEKYGKDSVFESGADYRAGMPQFRPESYDKNRELFALIRGLAEEKQDTPAQVSLAWMLCKKPYIVPIPSSRRPERLRENIGAADVSLTAEEVKKIDAALSQMEMSAVFGGHPSVK